MVDTHAHLGVCDAPDAELVARAREAGVVRILTVGMDAPSNRAAIAAAETNDGVFAAVGRHPNEATGFDDEAAADIEALAGHELVRAVGETGLDYYRGRASREQQMTAFEAHIAIARRAGLPLVIHMRDQPGSSEALDDTFATLASLADRVTVILHCCSAPPGRIGEAAERGWYCSFAGNATYPKATELRESARLVPEELLLVETDSPFLAPQPVRGQSNQPANVVHTARVVADVRGVDYSELEARVEANAQAVLAW